LGQWLNSGGSEAAGRRLGSALGFWTWTRYNNSLYAKQSYTALAKAMLLAPPRQQAWIEPSPVLYAQLASLLNWLRKTLPSPDVIAMTQLLRRCSRLSEIELSGARLSASDVNFLNRLDLAFLPLTGGKDHPIVVDVHSEPNSGMALEEALEFPEVVSRPL